MSSGYRKECRQDTSRSDIEVVNSDQVPRQPERERDEGAKDKEIVEGESPDLNISEPIELFDDTLFGFSPRFLRA